MTAPAIHPEAIDSALPDFDAEVACEFALCDHPQCQCDTPAVWRVTTHCARGIEDLRARRCTTFARPICEPHLARLREIVAEGLSQGPMECMCGRSFTQISDIIREVSAL